MQNDEYYNMIRAEWERVLGRADELVTDAERKELHDLIEKQKEQKGRDTDVH